MKIKANEQGKIESMDLGTADLFGEPLPAYVEKFYERSWRSWAVRVCDAEDNQIGDCEWCADRATAEQAVREQCKQYNVKERKRK